MTKEKRYTIVDISNAIEKERERVAIILEYILNKNSKSLSEGGMNHRKALTEIEELEHELRRFL